MLFYGVTCIINHALSRFLPASRRVVHYAGKPNLLTHRKVHLRKIAFSTKAQN